MSVLYHDQLIGRIDPKVDRKRSKLILKGFFLEDGVDLHEDLINGLDQSFRSFMDFRQAEDLLFERKDDAQLGTRINALL